MPAPLHREMAKFFDLPYSGIHIGRGSVANITPEARETVRRLQEANAGPRGWKPGEGWEQVPGFYLTEPRQVIIGDGHAHGSLSMAVHEFAHAVDDMLAKISSSQRWYDASGYAVGASRHPYFNFRVNPNGFWSEAFAESFAAWAKATQAGKNAEEAIADALDISDFTRSLAEVRQSLQNIVAFFEEVTK